MARRLGIALCGLLILTGTGLAEPSIHPLLRPLLGATPSAQIPGFMLATEGLPASAIGTGERFGVWVRTRDGGRSLESLGLHPQSDPSPLRSARWTRRELQAAAADPSVESITPVVRCFAALDSSLREIRADKAHRGHGTPPVYQGVTGRGIVIGIVDSGLDLLHGDFRTANGASRVLFLWDQTITTNAHPAHYAYGTEWSMGEINAGLSTERDDQGHGTHVTGIAVGNGAGTGNGQPAYRYVGVAPEATIISVKSDFMTDHLVDGVEYIFQKADSMHVPAIVNLSLGTQFGPHDGTDDMSQALNAIAGPGHIIIAAAGNETGKGLHARRVISAHRDSAMVTLSVSPYAATSGLDEIDLDGWYKPAVPLSFSVKTPGGIVVGPVPVGGTIDTNTPDGHVWLDNNGIGLNHDRNVGIRLYDVAGSDTLRSGIWTILIKGTNIPPADSTAFDVWNFFQSMPTRVTFLAGVDESDIVLSPATADSVISVAAYVSRTKWVAENGTSYSFSPPLPHGAIAPFSSIGFRRDGAVKPDVAAPGRGVASSLSSTATVDPHTVVQDGVHVVFEGTSMASPQVAGVVALMFQNLGPLAVHTTKMRFITTAKVDSMVGTVPNPTWGFGKIDAVRASGANVPVTLVDSNVRQDGDRMIVSFVLTQDAGDAPFRIWREAEDVPSRQLLGWTSRGPEKMFVDSTLTAEGRYSYWLEVPQGDESDWIGPARGRFILARTLSLDTSPNPCAGTTSIRWSIPTGRGAVTIYDIAGRRVRQFDCGPHLAGAILWDGSDAAGRPVPSGLYLARLKTQDGRAVERRILRLR